MMFDPIYWIILIVTFAISGIASLMVKSRFRKGQQVALSSGLTGADIARAILRDNGIEDVTVHEHQGFLSDHYNPMNKTLNLSPEVYHGRSASSAGVAAHEVGHAIQHSQNYFPMWVRSAIVPAANIGSNLGPWLVIIGAFLGVASGLGHSVAMLGVALFAMSTFFTLVTVPVEFDASARAKQSLLHMGVVRRGEEADAVAATLTAAGMTYVAAAISSIAMLLYWAMKAGLLGGRSDD